MKERYSIKFKGELLVLDNFRVVLKNYSLDVQDIVRSAILDGLDISEYISQYKNDPYKLDQIRLELKEGLNTSLFSVSGRIKRR